MTVHINPGLRRLDEVPSRPPSFDFDSAVRFLREPGNNSQAHFLAAFQCLADNLHRVVELSDARLIGATIARLIAHGLIRAPGEVCPTCPLQREGI